MESKKQSRGANSLLRCVAASRALTLIVTIGICTEACKKNTDHVAPIPDVSTIKTDPQYCDKKCKMLGLGAGKCVTDVGFCPGGINSAHCVCENGSAVPPPTPTPTPKPNGIT